MRSVTLIGLAVALVFCGCGAGTPGSPDTNAPTMNAPAVEPKPVDDVAASVQPVPLTIDDSTGGFSLLTDDEYHHFARTASAWHSVTSPSAQGGTALEAVCGEHDAGAVAMWSFEVPEGAYALSAFVPQSEAPATSVQYCLFWGQSPRRSVCQSVSQAHEGWLSLGVHDIFGPVDIALDPMACSGEYDGEVKVLADAMRLTSVSHLETAPND